jgi:hypothetical protein
MRIPEFSLNNNCSKPLARTFQFTGLLICFLLVADTGRTQIQKIYLHPKTVAKEKQTKFVDSIRFIPLEIPHGTELSPNYNVNVTQKHILLIDYVSKKLLVFSKNGKFIKDIRYKRFGENFYPSYKELTNEVIFFGHNKNYALTPKDLVQIKLDWNNPHNKKYFKKFTVDLDDPDFNVKKDIPDEKDIVQVVHLYDDYYVQGQISVSPLYSDTADHEFKIYKNNELVKSYFPYNRVSEPRFLYTQENIGLNRTDKQDVQFISRPFCDTIYKMIGDSIFPAFHLVLPLENILPASFYTKPFKNKTERENFYRNNGWVLRQVYGFSESPKFISFMVSYLSNYESYIYEKATNVTYKTKNIKPDSSQYNLELFSNFGTTRDGDKFYKTQKASDLFTFFEQNKNVPVPNELKDFIANKPEGTTPVIVEYKLKK